MSLSFFFFSKFNHKLSLISTHLISSTWKCSTRDETDRRKLKYKLWILPIVYRLCNAMQWLTLWKSYPNELGSCTDIKSSSTVGHFMAVTSADLKAARSSLKWWIYCLCEGLKTFIGQKGSRSLAKSPLIHSKGVIYQPHRQHIISKPVAIACV